MRLARIDRLKHPNPYAQAMVGEEFGPWVFDQERAPLQKGKWQELLGKPVCLELGTGNGTHFSHLAETRPGHLVLGLEMKFKPLVQSIRRARRAGCVNARMLRFDARFLELLFSENEIENVYVHFPDPWFSPRKPMNRMTSLENLQKLSRLQKRGFALEFKTDSQALFEWTLEQIEKSPYRIEHLSRDWHADPQSVGAHRSQFESLFARQGLKIHYALLRNSP